MFSIATSFTLASVTIAGIEAVSVRSDYFSLATDCTEIGSGTLYANTQFDDLIEAANTTIGTCEIFPSDDKIVSVSASHGNKCGSCVRVSVPGGGSEILKVFDHAYIIGTYEDDEDDEDDEEDFRFQIPQSTMERLVGYGGIDIVDITVAGAVCEEATEQKIEYSSENRYSLRLAGGFDGVTGVAVIAGDDIESVEYLQRLSTFTSYWELPLELRNVSAVYAFQRDNLDPVFVNVDINAPLVNNTIDVQMLDVDGEAVAYPSTCAAEMEDVAFEEIIEDFLNSTEEEDEEEDETPEEEDETPEEEDETPEEEDETPEEEDETPEEEDETPEEEDETPEERDSNDNDNDASALMATSFAASTVFAAVSLLF